MSWLTWPVLIFLAAKDRTTPLGGVLFGLAMLPVYWLSIHWNAIGLFAPASFDRGDTDTEGRYWDWGEGRKALFGLGAEHAAKNWADLVRAFPGSLGHSMRSFCFSYVKDYPKREVRVASAAFVVMEAVAVVGWLA